MERRRFLSIVGQAVTVVSANQIFASQPGRVREAVVIGVDKAGSLPRLRGAASGAAAFRDWLQGEGFKTTLLSDAAIPGSASVARVTANDVYSAIADRVKVGTVDQLVVYFAGHGYINSYSEFWMLSDAPDNPNEAVSLKESVELAKLCGIPNVAFISDACRSLPDSLGVGGVRGSLIFPNRTGVATKVGDVDVFLATHVAGSSFEVPVTDSTKDYQGIYTQAFLDAFKAPDPPMVRDIAGVKVVPNRRLKGYLEREVSRRAAAVSIQLRQLPDTQVVSDDEAYIGKVAASTGSAPAPPSAPATLLDVAESDLKLLGIRGTSGRAPAGANPVTPAEVERLKRDTGYGAANSILREPVKIPEAPGGPPATGVFVRGTAVRDASTSRAADRVDVRPGPDGTVIELKGDSGRNDPRSVFVRFADGSGTVVAALPRYWAVVSVDEGAVASVSYIPSRGHFLRGDYDSQRERIDALHAAVATAARFGVFRIEGGRESRAQAAAQLAGRVRMMKGADPTLGIYAAYAYADAGLPRQVTSVRDFMRGDLGGDVFDVAMLADSLNQKLAVEPVVTPPCPMLAQGWNYLRIKEIRLTPAFEFARDHLKQSLWTTFTSTGMQRIMEAR
jgi:hypothetical protein